MGLPAFAFDSGLQPRPSLSPALAQLQHPKTKIWVNSMICKEVEQILRVLDSRGALHFQFHLWLGGTWRDEAGGNSRLSRRLSVPL
jgi:hypothetical protein